MKRMLVLLCLALGPCAEQWLYSQNYVYAIGNQPFSTQIPIENGFINVNNGEIHIEISLATHAQRGRLPLNERLVYDSRIWQIISNGGYSWQPTNVPNSMGGWRFVTGMEPPVASRFMSKWRTRIAMRETRPAINRHITTTTSIGLIQPAWYIGSRLTLSSRTQVFVPGALSSTTFPISLPLLGLRWTAAATPSLSPTTPALRFTI